MPSPAYFTFADIVWTSPYRNRHKDALQLAGAWGQVMLGAIRWSNVTRVGCGRLRRNGFTVNAGRKPRVENCAGISQRVLSVGAARDVVNTS